MTDVTITVSMLIAFAIALVGLGVMIFGGKMKPNSRKLTGWITGIGVIVMILAIVFANALPTSLGFLNNPLMNKQVTVGGTTITYTTVPTNTQQTSNPTGGVSIVTTNPTIDIAGQDAQQPGTAVATTGSKYQINGAGFKAVTLGTTTAIPGQTIDLFLVNGTQYHNQVVQNLPVKVDTFPVKVAFNKNATVTENIYTTTGLVITNGGGAQNQTDLGNGKSYNLKDEMGVDSLTSTQDMVCIIELTSGNNASTSSPVTYGGQQPYSTSKPQWYTPAGVNSNVYLFNMPAISDTQTRTNTIQLTAKSDGRFIATSSMIKTCETKEWFVDPVSGKLTYDIADSQGTLKSMASYKYVVYFQ